MTEIAFHSYKNGIYVDCCDISQSHHADNGTGRCSNASHHGQTQYSMLMGQRTSWSDITRPRTQLCDLHWLKHFQVCLADLVWYECGFSHQTYANLNWYNPKCRATYAKALISIVDLMNSRLGSQHRLGPWPAFLWKYRQTLACVR